MKGSTVLIQSLKSWAKELGNKPAIIETNTDNQISYVELLRAVTAVEMLIGSQPQKIFLALPGGIVDSVVWLSALIFGHTLIPVSPGLTEFEYNEILLKHAPDVVISESQFTIKTNKNYSLQQIQKHILAFSSGPNNRSLTHRDGLVYLETSGSTGKPKGMLLSTSQIVITAGNIQAVHKITKDDRGLTPLPFYHVNAPVVSLVTTILSGSTLIIAPKFSASNFWKWIEKYNPTWASIVPTIVAILLKSDRPASLDTSSIRFMRTASAPLPKSNLLKFEKKFKIPLIETYGISEAASTITANPLPPQEHKPGSVGKPLGIEMEIRDAKAKDPITEHTIGDVWIKGQQVISSYIGNADAASFENGWFRTGDVGYFDSEGYLFLTGRSREMIIRGGENIAPREIEEVLITFPGIEEVAVIGQADPIYGERIVAFVVREKILDRLSDDEFCGALKTYAQQMLSAQKVPESITILDQLPRGRTGKIDKPQLKSYTQTNNFSV